MKTGQQEKMLAIAIDQLIEDPAYYNSFTSTIQRSFTNDSEYDNLLKVVFQKVQQYPENAQLIELLAWIYIQKKGLRQCDETAQSAGYQVGQQLFEGVFIGHDSVQRRPI
jgi:hypothetical protein